MKKCALCFIEKEIIEFNLSNRKYGDNRSSYCKPCQSAYYKAYNASRKTAQAKVILMAKTCRDCGLEKPISQFGKRALSPDKHNIYCKLCWRKRVAIAQRKMKNGG
jgi:RNase P subunit RPR2